MELPRHRRQKGKGEEREPVVLEPTAADKAQWAAAERHRKANPDEATVSFEFRGKSVTMTAEKFEEMAQRMRGDGTAGEDADAPPAFEPFAKMGAVHVSILARDRDLLNGALNIASAEAAKAIGARRNLGLKPDAQLEGIHATARSLSQMVEKQEPLDDGRLSFELNGSSAPVLRIALWLWMRWAEHLDERAKEKGLPTFAVRGIKVAEEIADSIIDQLGLL
jgi:hypothetical protein